MIRLSLALLIGAAGCSHDRTENVAVGWTVESVAPLGKCKAPTDRTSASVQPMDVGGVLAVKPGDTVLDCRDGAVTLHVEQPTLLTIAPIARVKSGAAFIVTASASANGRGLALGDAAVGWTVPPGLALGEMCTEGSCVKPSSARVVATTPGTFEIKAQLGALTATATVVVN